MEIHIDTNDVAQLSALWDKAPAITAEEMLRGVTEANLLIEREVKERTPVGVGGGAGLRGSIHSIERRTPHTVIGVVGTSMNYAVPVELGTKPHFPPVAPIKDWVIAKLGVAADKAEGIAWAVAKKIASKGTEGAEMFTTGLNATEPQINRIMHTATARVLERITPA